MSSVFNGMGYLFNDDRASGGKFIEADLLGCNHCDRTFTKRQWFTWHEPRCLGCFRSICPECVIRAQTRGCENATRRLERAIEERHRRAQNARMIGA